MIRLPTLSALLPALSLVLFTGATGVSAPALSDEPPPPPTLAACKKQADDQKLPAGSARRDFVKNCMKSVPTAPPAA
jgi:hypothetical protein